MKKTILMDKYPIYTKEILKENTNIKNANQFISILKEKIDNDNNVKYITTFDHFKYTLSLKWNIIEWMISWKILIFCFWHEILNSLSFAIKPRNISVVEFKNRFEVSFLESPKKKINDKKISWILESI